MNNTPPHYFSSAAIIVTVVLVFLILGVAIPALTFRYRRKEPKQPPGKFPQFVRLLSLRRRK